MASAVALIPGMRPSPQEAASVNLRPPAAQLEKAARAGNVAPVRTPITTEQASSLIAGALEEVTGEKPSPECVAVMTAQWAHETGRGASMFNYNFAGIKGTGPSGLSVSQRTREGWGATERTITDNFRAYRTAEEGALDYVKLLASRFPESFAAARQGDPAACVAALKRERYFTGNEAAYTRSVTRIAREIAPDALNFQTVPDLPVLDAAPRPALALREGSSGTFHDPFAAPFVDAAALGAEISRAALRILSTPSEDRDRSRDELNRRT
jgi:hypothetical protein